MKKIYFLLLTLISTFSFAQGSETFDGFSEPGNGYADGTFTGQDGSAWTYTQCRGDFEITGSAIMIGRNRTPQAEVYSGVIPGGVGTISFNYMQAFGTNVNLNVLVNDVVVGNVTSSGEQDVIKSSGTITVNQPGDVVIKFINAVNSAGQVVIDDIVWTGQTGTAPPSVTITSPSDGTVFAPGTTTTNIEFATANLTGSESVTITVNGTPTTNATSPFQVTVADGQSYTVTADLVDGGSTLDTDTVTFSVDTATQVANLTELRAGVIGQYYQVMNVPTVTYTRPNRNQKYIQDSSNSAILIDDSAGVIATAFEIGDGMSGLVGELGEFNGVLQFIPSVDATVATGMTITPQVVTVPELLSNWEVYESELVQINNTTFADAGATFAVANYDISDSNGGPMVFRPFAEADYVGGTIPSGTMNLVALVAEFGGAPQVSARSLADVLSTNSYQLTGFNVYPNPTSTGFVNITSKTNELIQVAVYDILGKQVLNQTVNNNRLNVSTLNTGVYIMKISQNGQTISKKLVVK